MLPQAFVLAALSVYVPPEEVARVAPVVVEGTVERVASGLDPETGRLATYVTLSVGRVLRGPDTWTTVVLREPGGRYGDLEHALDAVPVYVAGERVVAFLEAAPDGAMRTAHRFFGKFSLVDDALERDLSGQGLILRAPAEVERFSAPDLVATVETNPYRPSRARSVPLPVPPELDRVLWDPATEHLAPSSVGNGSGGTLDLAASPRGSSGPGLDFTPLNTSTPVRWTESDSGSSVVVNIEPARNPLANATSAVNEIKRAMAAWTNVPEARVVLQSGNENYNFTGANAQGPADAYPPTNIILFGDPYNDITDPSGCSGTLAIGGYWNSGSGGTTVNNVTFRPALRLYVIFNNNFECFLGIADNLAEVATHELGHGLGYGHSAVADAVMRSSAYGGGRGPRLGNDDIDGAHCHYPHALTLSSPNGGESWPAGSVRTIAWTATAEMGSDPGTVSLEYSTDGGTAWSPIVVGTSNDGVHAWTVPNAPGTQTRVRVIRPNRVSPTPSPYPSACSSDASNANFTITAASASAGSVPESGTPVRVNKAAGSDLAFTWGTSCSGQAADYAIYEGTLAALRSGSFDHVPLTCAAGTDLAQTLTPGAGSRYYLLAARAGSIEGALGHGRPASASACAPREASSCP